jgi:predicted RNA-binding Zn ribbon-like protein
MRFAFVSGNVGLDYAGTVGHRTSDAVDLLGTPDDLARWLVAAGVIDEPVAVTGEDLDLGVLLRESIYRLARAGVPYADEDRLLLNGFAAVAPVRVRLGEDGRVHRSGDVASALATVARATIELLAGEHAHHIRECVADRCTRLFVDASARQSRRWCDMKECGNRAKAAGFRARHG